MLKVEGKERYFLIEWISGAPLEPFLQEITLVYFQLSVVSVINFSVVFLT